MIFVEKSPNFSTLSSNTVSYRVSTPLISIVGAHNKEEALVASSSGHCKLWNIDKVLWQLYMLLQLVGGDWGRGVEEGREDRSLVTISWYRHQHWHSSSCCTTDDGDL